MDSSDTIFPSGVVNAPGSPHFVPDESMGPTRHRAWHHRQDNIDNQWLSRSEARHRIAEIVESGQGNPLMPGSKGNMTVRAKGILVNAPTTESDDDSGAGTDEVVQANYGIGRDKKIRIDAIRRGGEAIGPDEDSTPDPFGGAGRAVIEARSGNEDPDGDNFTVVGSGSPYKRQKGVSGLGEASSTSWGPTLLAVGVAAAVIWMLTHKKSRA